MGAAEVEDLAGDEVEEGEVVFDGDERLGLIEAHAGAESAVEFDDAETVEECGFGGIVHDVRQIWNAVGGGEGIFRDESGVAGGGLVPSTFEAGAGGKGQSGVAHFLQRRGGSALVHGAGQAFLVEAM